MTICTINKSPHKMPDVTCSPCSGTRPKNPDGKPLRLGMALLANVSEKSRNSSAREAMPKVTELARRIIVCVKALPRLNRPFGPDPPAVPGMAAVAGALFLGPVHRRGGAHGVHPAAIFGGNLGGGDRALGLGIEIPDDHRADDEDHRQAGQPPVIEDQPETKRARGAAKNEADGGIRGHLDILELRWLLIGVTISLGHGEGIALRDLGHHGKVVFATRGSWATAGTPNSGWQKKSRSLQRL